MLTADIHSRVSYGNFVFLIHMVVAVCMSNYNEMVKTNLKHELNTQFDQMYAIWLWGC